MFKNLVKLKNAFLVMLVTLFFLFMLSNWFYEQERKEFKETAIRFIQQIEGLKGQVFLINQLTTSLLAGSAKPEKLISTNEIYSLNFDQFLQSNGTKLSNKLHEIFSRKYSWLNSSDLMYFKLFDSQTVLSNRVINHFEKDPAFIEAVFSDKYCNVHQVCTLTASEENLFDGFIFSNIHVSFNTNRKTLSIAAPSIIDGKIVAESHIDVNLEDWVSLAGMHISSTRDGEFMNIRVSNKPYKSKLFWEKNQKIDNFVTVTFVRHYGSLIVKGIVLLFLAIIFNVIFVSYWLEKNKHSKTKLESMSDPLTGCYNRKVLESRSLEAMMNENNTNTVVVFDGNKIKHINDNYGHEVGDIAIVNIATAIKNSFRKEDIVIRTGGDEFVVIALGLTSAIAPRIVKSIYTKLAAQPVFNDETVSVSAGISECKTYAELREAISKADGKLYDNKKEQI